MITTIALAAVSVLAVGCLTTMGIFVYYALTGRIAEVQGRAADAAVAQGVVKERDSLSVERDQLKAELELKNHAIDIYRDAATRKTLEVIRDQEKIDVSDAEAVLDAARRRRALSSVVSGELRTEVSAADRPVVSVAASGSAAGHD